MNEIHEGHPRRWAALGVLCLSLVVPTLDNTVLNTALPTLARALTASTADLQWITDAYTLVFASLLILAGSIAVRTGIRRALTLGMVGFALGSAGAALSHTSAELIFFRAVMGLGATFVMPATLALIVLMFPQRGRPKAIAIWSATAGVGVAIGPVLGGELLVHFAWGSVFWINVPLIAVALVGIFRVVPAVAARRGARLDFVGALLCTAGLAVLVDLIIEGPQRGWTSARTLVEAGLAVVLLVAFVGWELRTAEPMVDVRIFANRVFAVANVALGVTFFALFGALFVFSQYLQLVHGFSPLRAGLGAVPFALAMAATAGVSNLVTQAIGTRWSVVAGLLVVGAGFGILALTTTTHTPFWRLATEIAVAGAGMGLVMAPSSLATLSVLPREQAAMASSMNSVTRELGGVIGIAVVGSVVSAGYRNHMHAAGTTGPVTTDLPTAHITAAHLPAGAAHALLATADHAFTTAMNVGMTISALVAVAGALAAWRWLTPRRAEHAATEQALVPQA